VTPAGATFQISADSTALLVVDMQNDFVAPGAPYESTTARQQVSVINELADQCRAVGIPVFFTAHVHRSDGSDLGVIRQLHPLTAAGQALRADTPGVQIYPELIVGADDEIIHKRRFSAFYETDLDQRLRRRGVDTLVMTGVAGNVCCDSTTRDAFYRDYRVIYVSDANAQAALADSGWGAISEHEVEKYQLSLISQFFGEVVNSTEVLQRVAATTVIAGPART
jgi:ureidoacrylate peracid hydrolase